KSFKAVLELPTSGTGYYAVSDTSFVTKITSFPLMVSVTPENNSSGSTADPGSTLQYVVRYQNNSSEPQQAMEVKVELLGKALDLTQVEAENALIENGLITWNASTATELEAVKAGGSGTFKFSVPVRNPPTKDSTKNLIVKVNPKISSRANPAGYPGPGLTVKINSYLRTTTSLSYQSGALPPRVGQVTTYKVTVSARTGVNDIKDGSVVFFVPLSKGSVVESSLLASIGKATFDSSISKLTWQIGQIPAFAGTFEKPATLTFTVNLTPTQTMRGREVTILKDIGVNGADMFTAKSFLGTLPNLTTSNTENAGDKGYVQ
ncbi:MAG TPA: hypothetical protein VEA59_04820, partial [Patescibacteria group bacterium]|nr:hypothetical protein [Patescibacteria group bacterium]